MYQHARTIKGHRVKVKKVCREINQQICPAVVAWSVKAASNVGVMYRSHGPNTGSNPGGGQIPKKICLPHWISMICPCSFTLINNLC